MSASLADSPARPSYLTPREIAAELRLSLNTVYAMLGTPDGIPAIRVRGQWRIPTDRYEAWRNGERPAQLSVVVPIAPRLRGRR